MGSFFYVENMKKLNKVQKIAKNVSPFKINKFVIVIFNFWVLENEVQVIDVLCSGFSISQLVIKSLNRQKSVNLRILDIHIALSGY